MDGKGEEEEEEEDGEEEKGRGIVATCSCSHNHVNKSKNENNNIEVRGKLQCIRCPFIIAIIVVVLVAGANVCNGGEEGCVSNAKLALRIFTLRLLLRGGW
jgi:hypothetical protein